MPARRAEGKTKTKLVPDPLRAPVVQQIFRWRAIDRLGYTQIAERLNRDLDRHPPPESPDPARRRDDWSRSTVQDLLRNPKYTGYMVWNRRATKKGGRLNPPDSWVWSPRPTHQGLVTRDTFEAAAGVGQELQRRRADPGANARHPQTKRSYLLRSFVVCKACGHRMHGKTRRKTAYYACEPSHNLGPGVAGDRPGHPKSLWVREEHLVPGILSFFAERVFGPRRIELMQRDLERLSCEADREGERRIRALEDAAARLEARQARLVRSLEENDGADGAMFRHIRTRMGELEAERLAKLERLREFKAERAEGDTSGMDLLDALPLARGDLALVPEGSCGDCSRPSGSRCITTRRRGGPTVG